MKKCPYCAEEIQDEAIICRFCGRELEEKIPEISRSTFQQTHSPVWKTGLILGGLISVLSIFLAFIEYIQGRMAGTQFEGRICVTTPILFIAFFMIGTSLSWIWRWIKKRAHKGLAITILISVLLITVIIIWAVANNPNFGSAINQLLPIQSSTPKMTSASETTSIPTNTPNIASSDRQDFLSLCESFKVLHNEVEAFEGEWSKRITDFENTYDLNKKYNTTLFYINWWNEITKSATELPETTISSEFSNHLDRALEYKYKELSALADHFYHSGEIKYHDQYVTFHEVASEEYNLALDSLWVLAIRFGYDVNDCLE